MAVLEKDNLGKVSKKKKKCRPGKRFKTCKRVNARVRVDEISKRWSRNSHIRYSAVFGSPLTVKRVPGNSCYYIGGCVLIIHHILSDKF